jgi:DNA-binding beta-propeller fold protein YncE
MLKGIVPRLASLIAAAALAGCGSSPAEELPPAAAPDVSPPLEQAPAGRVVPIAELPEGLVADPVRATVDGGRAIAVLSPRERVLELYDSETRERIARAPAGAGPTHVVAGERGLAYVVDTAGDGLLVFDTHGELRVLRRYPLPGAPYGAASDLRGGRLWVTLTARNELVELATSARPHRLASYPTVRQPDDVAVDPSSGRVFVTGKADGVLQLLDPRRSR